MARALVLVVVLCAGLIAGAGPLRAAGAIQLELHVELDGGARRLAVQGEARVPAGGATDWRLRGDFALTRIELDGRALVGERRSSHHAWRVPAGARERVLRFSYRAELPAAPSAADHRSVLGLAAPVAGPEGSWLPAGSAWHPEPVDRPVAWHVRLTLPASERGFVMGRLVDERLEAGHWRAEYRQGEPLAGIDLFAGPYVVAERRVALGDDRSLPIRAWFHPDLAELAPGYLDAAAGFIQRYDRMIGPYPFATFAIVSSPLPTGFGMPGVAYLGRQVLRLPFIRGTSLGHEVLHNWFGNGIVPDYAGGNWSEGLTTLLADYAYREDESTQAARDMRFSWLRDFAAVPSALDRPLAEFVARRHGAGQAVGYNKTAFVFLMLRDDIGEAAFERGLRALWKSHRLRVAGWADLRRAFEGASGRDLAAFFQQWVTRSGAPEVSVVDARRARAAHGSRIEVVLAQSGSPWRLRVPIAIELADGRVQSEVVEMNGARITASIDLPATPVAVTLDPDARVFRRLAPDEIAPTFRPVLIDPRTALVTAADAPDIRAAARKLAEAALDHGVRPWAGEPGVPLFVVGIEADLAPVLARLGLPAAPEALRGRGSAYAWAGRKADGVAYLVVAARDAAALEAAARSLPHLGGQSHAVFEGGRSIERGVWPARATRVGVRG